MGKQEDLLKQILEKVTNLDERISSIEFTLIQGIGSGTGLPGASGTTATPSSSAVAELDALNQKIDQLLLEMKTISNAITKKMDVTGGGVGGTPLDSSLINTVKEALSEVNTKLDRIGDADAKLTTATTLLEKGLQLTELEGILLEIRDRLEEIVFELTNMPKLLQNKELEEK